MAYLITNGARTLSEIAKFCKLSEIVIESLLAEIINSGDVVILYDETTKEYVIQ